MKRQEWGLKEPGEQEPGILSFDPAKLAQWQRPGDVLMTRWVTDWEDA